MRFKLLDHSIDINLIYKSLGRVCTRGEIMDDCVKHAIESFSVNFKKNELLDKISMATESVCVELDGIEEDKQRRRDIIILDIYNTCILKIAENLKFAIGSNSGLNMSVCNVDVRVGNALYEGASVIFVAFDHYLDNKSYDLIKNIITALLNDILLDHVMQNFSNDLFKEEYRKRQCKYAMVG